MSFIFNLMGINGLTLITVNVFTDERGYYSKFFEKDLFKKNDLPVKFAESSVILSHKGVLRGLHFQKKKPQGKLIQVLFGEIYDVALDLRRESCTFGCWRGIFLNSTEAKLLYIPEGFAHGFLTLQDKTMIMYQSTNSYYPKENDGIIWSDKDLKIPWPINDIKDLIVSDKDKKLPSFQDYKSKENI